MRDPATHAAFRCERMAMRRRPGESVDDEGAWLTTTHHLGIPITGDLQMLNRAWH
jgi:hypothetical protein